MFGIMYCAICGKECSSNATYCDGCGAKLSGGTGPQGTGQGYSNPMYVTPQKSAGLAAVLALLLPGLGHIYVGKLTTGILLMFMGIILAAFAMSALFIFHYVAVGLFLILPILLLIVWVWNIYDAYTLANKYNDHLRMNNGNPPW